MLSDEEMRDVKGGYFRNSFETNNSRILSKHWRDYQNGLKSKCGSTRFGTPVCF
ncbi:hypothetical protein [uncultured Helicobacter sp.]|uniref:hypothetical protein n=1 Tax=uncultured Helicobacter sp. TaxID=175537 RepID=UPI002634D5AE|nr:hypothetical protein [uncultured Helicobacter sp.]